MVPGMRHIPTILTQSDYAIVTEEYLILPLIMVLVVKPYVTLGSTLVSKITTTFKGFSAEVVTLKWNAHGTL